MQLKHPNAIQEYSANRSKLLEQIMRILERDDRFVAAWLTESFGRNDADDCNTSYLPRRFVGKSNVWIGGSDAQRSVGRTGCQVQAVRA